MSYPTPKFCCTFVIELEFNFLEGDMITWNLQLFLILKHNFKLEPNQLHQRLHHGE
jgi:hypothetical protein